MTSKIERRHKLWGYYCKRCFTKFSILHDSIGEHKITTCPFCANPNLEEL